MSPQTLSITLTPDSIAQVQAQAYNAATLILPLTGDLTGMTTLKGELHANAAIGGTPLAEYEFPTTLGAGPHTLTFTAAKMNQLSGEADEPSREFILVILGRTGAPGLNQVKTVLSYIRLTLLAAPAGDTPALPPAVTTYIDADTFNEAIADLQSQIDALGTPSAPSWNDQDLTTLAAVAQGDLVCATGITETPSGRVDVFYSSMRYLAGNGVKTQGVYFSGNGGTTARAYGAIVAGDMCYLGGAGAAVGGIGAGESISFNYNA